MNCPSCNQTASSFLRNAFSLQGVTISKSIQGYFKCQNCGTLLRVVSVGRQSWFFYMSAVIVLGLFLFFSRHLLLAVGVGSGATDLIRLLAVSLIIIFWMWKYGKVEVEKVEKSTPNESA